MEATLLGGRNILFHITFLFFGYLNVSSQTGPGGVGNAATNNIWLSGDYGVYLDNGTTLASKDDQVRLWHDRSGNNRHANQATAANRPLYHTNSANGYSGLRFHGDMFIDGPALGIANNSGYTYLICFRDTLTGLGGTTNGVGHYILDRVPASNSLVSLKPVTGNRYFYQKRNDAGGASLGGVTGTTAINTNTKIIEMRRDYDVNYQIFYNNTLEGTLNNNTDGATTPEEPRIGRHCNIANGGIRGYINEFIVYSFALNNAQTIIVNNYLAAKYGLTLGSNDFYTMDNPANGNYDHEVAGIGRFSASEQHTDAQGSSFVRINNASGLDVNGEYLIWGHDNVSIQANNTVDVDGTIIEARLSRVWRLSEVGDVGTVTVTFDYSTFSALVGSDLRLLIDRNGNGFFDNDVTPQAGVVSGSTISFNLVDFQNGDRFTLGSINEAQSPLPVELLSFNAISQTNSVDLIWQTATESNSSHFEVLRSKTGMEWEKIGEIGAQGNSSTPTQYHFSDFNPLAGYSYYKLNMVDLDLSQEFSNVAVVNRTTAEDDINIFPNPANDFVYVESQMGLDNATIRIYDCTGRVATVPVYKDSYKMMVEITTLSSGVYYLEIESEGAVVRKKIVVDRN